MGGEKYENQELKNESADEKGESRLVPRFLT